MFLQHYIHLYASKWNKDDKAICTIRYTEYTMLFLCLNKVLLIAFLHFYVPLCCLHTLLSY